MGKCFICGKLIPDGNTLCMPCSKSLNAAMEYERFLQYADEHDFLLIKRGDFIAMRNDLVTEYIWCTQNSDNMEKAAGIEFTVNVLDKYFV